MSGLITPGRDYESRQGKKVEGKFRQGRAKRGIIVRISGYATPAPATQ